MRRRAVLLPSLVALAAVLGALGSSSAGAHPGEAHVTAPGALGGHGLFGGLARGAQADAAAAA